jgi:predicted peptidase
MPTIAEIRTMTRLTFLAVVVPGLLTVPVLAGDKQQEKSFEAEIKVKVKLNYLLALPDDYEKSDKKFPLLLFLHGAGESGDDLSQVKKHGPPKLIEAGKFQLPFIVVSPQSPGRGWRPEALAALLDEVCAKHRVDKQRVYLTGLSMGGAGTWALAASQPDRFAAIAPICGFGNTRDAEKLKGIATWVFHGAKDPVVPVSRSEEMVAAIKPAGGNPKLTIYPDAEHDSWTQTYENPDFYEWLFEHKRP